MKKKIFSVLMVMAMAASMIGCGNKETTEATSDAEVVNTDTEGAVYKVGIIQYVDKYLSNTQSIPIETLRYMLSDIYYEFNRLLLHLYSDNSRYIIQ